MKDLTSYNQEVSSDDIVECEWCNEDYEESELINTKIGNICFTCKRAIESRGEDI